MHLSHQHSQAEVQRHPQNRPGSQCAHWAAPEPCLWYLIVKDQHPSAWNFVVWRIFQEASRLQNLVKNRNIKWDKIKVDLGFLNDHAESSAVAAPQASYVDWPDEEKQGSRSD